MNLFGRQFDNAKTTAVPRVRYGLVLLACLFLTAGCMDRKIETGYGKASGDSYGRSVNGTAVFHSMIEATGYEVERYGKYSPRWERYQTVFWIPDSFGPPGEDVIDRVDDWLATDGPRTLVYVARDFDAANMYWDTLRQGAAGKEEQDDLSRQFLEATTGHLLNRQAGGKLEGCDWYDVANHPYTKPEKITGDFVDELDVAELDLRYGTLPAPGDLHEAGQFGDYSVEVLMSVDGYPFIYSLTKPKYSGGRIIVVGNSSFLLNFPLINATNRELATELIYLALENEYSSDEVLFIESKYTLPISDRDSPERQSQWEWIAKKPLRYIVPNILFCSLLFCFVYFPIFGRPKKIKQRSTANFRDHINALGQLIRKTKSRTIPNSWIEEYRRRSSSSRSRSESVQKNQSTNPNENE